MTAGGSISIQPLGEHHDRAACGVDELDTYLKRRAGQDVRRRVARVFICTEEGENRILGFYTLSALSVDISSLPEDAARKLPKPPVPVALIGRLAVAEDAQGQGIGQILLADAVKRTVNVSEEIAVYALVVDAKDDRARAFYEGFGFLPLPDQKRRLFLPLASVVS